MKKKKYHLSGSYTIEASFIFPMIMVVIVSIIYLLFFVHDRCVINAAADTAALRGSQCRSFEGNLYEEVEKDLQELLQDRLLATRGVDKEIEITSKEIRVSYKGELAIPFHDIRLPMEVAGYAKRTDPVAFIRECRIIEEKTGKE